MPESSRTAQVPQANQVFSVRRRVEQKIRVLAEDGTAVVVSIEEGQGGGIFRGRSQGRENFHFSGVVVPGMVLGAGSQPGQPLSHEALGQGEIVRVAEPLFQADQLTLAQEDEVSSPKRRSAGQVEPLQLQGTGRQGFQVASFGDGPEPGPGQGTSLEVQDFDMGIQRGIEPLSRDLQGQRPPPASRKAEDVNVLRRIDPAVDGDGNGDRLGRLRGVVLLRLQGLVMVPHGDPDGVEGWTVDRTEGQVPKAVLPGWTIPAEPNPGLTSQIEALQPRFHLFTPAHARGKQVGHVGYGAQGQAVEASRAASAGEIGDPDGVAA